MSAISDSMPFNGVGISLGGSAGGEGFFTFVVFDLVGFGFRLCEKLFDRRTQHGNAVPASRIPTNTNQRRIWIALRLRVA